MPIDAKAVVEVRPVVLSTSSRHGVPRVPDARVSPRPTATSAVRHVPGVSDCVDSVCNTKETSEGTIVCISTAILAVD